MPRRIITVKNLLWRYPAWRVAAKLTETVLPWLLSPEDSPGEKRLYRCYLLITFSIYILSIKFRLKLPAKWVVLGIPSTASEEDCIEIYAVRKKDIVGAGAQFARFDTDEPPLFHSQSDMSDALREWIIYHSPILPHTELSLMRRREALGSMVDMDNVRGYGTLRFAAAIVGNMLSFGWREDGDAKKEPLDHNWDLTIEELMSKLEADIENAPTADHAMGQMFVAPESYDDEEDREASEDAYNEMLRSELFIYQTVRSLRDYWTE